MFASFLFSVISLTLLVKDGYAMPNSKLRASGAVGKNTFVALKKQIPSLVKHEGKRSLATSPVGNKGAEELQNRLLAHQDINSKKKGPSTPDERNLAMLAMGNRVAQRIKPNSDRQHRDLAVSFDEYCSATIGPYTSAGYSCTCDSTDQYVYCDKPVGSVYQMVLLSYDSVTAGHEYGADCICSDPTCQTFPTDCILILEDSTGQASCAHGDISTDSDPCVACTICGTTDGTYDVNADACRPTDVGEEPLGCHDTDLFVTPPGEGSTSTTPAPVPVSTPAPVTVSTPAPVTVSTPAPVSTGTQAPVAAPSGTPPTPVVTPPPPPSSAMSLTAFNALAMATAMMVLGGQFIRL